MLSNTENRDLMTQAREALDGRWALGVGVALVYFLLLGIVPIIPIIGPILAVLLAGPISLGLVMFGLSVARKEDASISQLFNGLNQFGTGLGAYLLQILFVFLWLMLLIIPGIIAALAYAMTYFIIAEDKSIGPLEAISKSKEMMRGYKMKLFFMTWRFFGWSILCVLTLGIGYLWLIPYIIVSMANFYEDIKDNPLET